MDCGDFVGLTTEPLINCHNLGGDEWIILHAIYRNGFIVSPSKFASNSTIIELNCRGWLIRSVEDGMIKYRMNDATAAVFEVYMKEDT